MSELFTKGNFIAFTDVEDGEKYTIRGEVSKVVRKTGMVHLKAEAPYGDVAISMDEASKMKAIKKPKTLKKFKVKKTRTMSSTTIKKPTKPASIKQSVARSKRTGVPSKKDRAVELFDASLSRQENIDVFVVELEMTAAGASTYVAMAKKANS